MLSQRLKFLRLWELVQREGADHYILISLLSFAASVCIIRFFLSVTDYPTIGGGEYHIAHVLWGGLMLYLSALAMLILTNRRVYILGAILSGVGVGFFIDEVGKFITTRNDYFFPVAAPIVYVLFLLVALLFIRIRKPIVPSPQAELSRAMENVMEMLHHPPKAKTLAAVEARLSAIAVSQVDTRHALLARLLLEFLHDNQQPAPAHHADPLERGLKSVNRWLTARRLRGGLVTGLILLGLLCWKNPALQLAMNLNIQWLVNILSFHIGRQFEVTLSPELMEIRVVMELFLGALLLVSAILLTGRWKRAGIDLGSLALLLNLTILDLLVFFFEQFSTAISAGFQLIFLLGLLYYRRRFLRAENSAIKYWQSVMDEIELALPNENPLDVAEDEPAT
jgi:hypothetical protein